MVVVGGLAERGARESCVEAALFLLERGAAVGDRLQFGALELDLELELCDGARSERGSLLLRVCVCGPVGRDCCGLPLIAHVRELEQVLFEQLRFERGDGDGRRRVAPPLGLKGGRDQKGRRAGLFFSLSLSKKGRGRFF